jgi:hypothetical protein
MKILIILLSFRDVLNRLLKWRLEWLTAFWTRQNPRGGYSLFSEVNGSLACIQADDSGALMLKFGVVRGILFFQKSFWEFFF